MSCQLPDSHSSIGLGNICQRQFKIVPQDLDDELRSTFDSKLAECGSICIAEKKSCDHTLIGHGAEMLCDIPCSSICQLQLRPRAHRPTQFCQSVNPSVQLRNVSTKPKLESFKSFERSKIQPRRASSQNQKSDQIRNQLQNQATICR